MPVWPPQAIQTTFDPRSLHLMRWSAAGTWKLLSTTPCTWCSWGYAETSTRHRLHIGFAMISLGQVMFLKDSVNFQKISGPNVVRKRHCYSASVVFSFGHPIPWFIQDSGLPQPNSGYQWKSVIYWSSQWVQSNSWNTRSPFFLYQSLATKDQGWFHPLHTCQHGLRQRKPLPGIGVHLQGCISQECPVVFCKESYRHSWAIPTRILSKFMNPWKYCGWKKSCAAG